MGRPSSYTEDIAETICERLANGESLVKICKDENIPSQPTIYSWLDKFPDFLKRYTRARRDQAEFLANEIIEIADEKPVRQFPSPDGGMDEGVDAAGVQRNKLRVDARKWYAAKVLPEKYGDKLDLNVSGELSIADRIAAARKRKDG